ncbi:MAG: DUF2680 domain-containing protein [Desulfocucumaceae bacterium]
MFRKKRIAGILVVVLILAVTVTGVAMATSNPQANPAKVNLFQDFAAKLAANLGMDQDKVVAALDATKKQMLDEAVQQGRITQEQADKMAAGKNVGPGMFGGFNGKMHDRKQGFKDFGRNNGDMAKILGITEDELKSELQSGKKMQQILADHGVTAEQFHQQMLEIKKEALSKAVSEGKLTQEQYDKMIQRMGQRFNNPAQATGN